MSAPGNEVPVWAPASGQLGRSDTAYVGITGVRVYTTGISLDVSIRLRHEPRATCHRMHKLVSGDRIRGQDIPSKQRLDQASGTTARSPPGGVPISSPRPRRNVSWA